MMHKHMRGEENKEPGRARKVHESKKMYKHVNLKGKMGEGLEHEKVDVGCSIVSVNVRDRQRV